MQKKWQSSLENLAKSGYKPEMKYKTLIWPSTLLPTHRKTKHQNLTIFIIFSLAFGN
jgi:hypothetical protein